MQETKLNAVGNKNDSSCDAIVLEDKSHKERSHAEPPLINNSNSNSNC
jgi:hypothetical protein